jgi:hypothetical protein
MIEIRSDQIEKFVLIAKESFFISSRKLLCGRFPDKYNSDDLEEMDESIHNAILTSQNLNLKKESSIQRVMLYDVHFDFDVLRLSFEEKKIVSSANLTELDRLDFLYKILKKK